ncbi:HAD family phosphatase [Angustibacter sp. Root456]|uniref:HAD family hydrolase n=1 Tax=Angustibacter sp. Root456 TaxID=1736539 RepID=UPI0006F75E60|nr:HAD family phosphatase [Angustibacter sp. Root456]KQX66546.1 hydrolase [Angustibacter sp. Root456]
MPPEAAPSLPAAVLWDMDGTLVDTEPYWIAEEHRLVEQYGGAWTAEHAKALVGNDLLVSAHYIKEHGDVPLEPEQIVDVLLTGVVERLRVEVPWRPGARDLLAELRRQGVPLALVTMSWTALADTFLAACGPDTFDVVVTGDRVPRGKPHPDPYLTAARALAVDPTACVAIEDSQTGVTSAEAAGVPTLAVPHVVHVPAAPGRSRANSLAEITVADLARIAAGETIDLVLP